MSRKPPREFLIQDINHAPPDIAALLEQFYDLGRPLEIRSSEYGETNRNFYVLCDKDGKQQKYFAKLYGAYKTLDSLNYENELYHYFQKNSSDVMQCPSPITAKTGDIVFVGNCKSANIKAFFMVFEHLRGVPLDDGTWRYRRHPYIQNFARAIAKFHKFSYGFTPSLEVPDRSDFLSDLITQKETIEKCNLLNGIPRTQAYYDYFTPKKNRIIYILERNTELYRKMKDNLPLCLTHGDADPTNYMFDENGEACAACDFDWSKTRPRLFDVAWMICIAVYRKCHLEDTWSDYYYEFDRVAEFLKAYSDAVSTDRNFLPGGLSKSELEMLPYMMQLIYIQCAIYDRFNYMLENNQRLGRSEDNFRVSNMGIRGIEFIEEHLDEFQCLVDLCC